MPLLINSILLAFVCACCVVDVRTRRIPNALSGSALLVGVGLNAWFHGAAALAWIVAGAGLMLVLLLPAFALGGIGGGDVKMMAAIGALIGPRLLLSSLCVGLMLGGVFMVVHLARRAQLGETLARSRRMLTNALLSRSADPLRVSSTSADAIALPYSLPLGLGTFGVIALAMARSS